MTTDTNTNEGTEANQTGLPAGVKPEDTDQPVRDAGAPEGHKPEESKNEDSASDEETKDKNTDEDSTDKSDADSSDDNDNSEDSSEEVEYISYGDANADAVVDILKEGGIPAQDAFNLFKEAAETGDMSTIDKSVLVEKLGKSKADLVMLGVEKYYTTTIQATKDIAAAVYAEAGGEDNYTKVQKWAKEKSDADPEFKTKVDSFNQMFDLNKTAASIAARELVTLYNEDSGNSSLTKNIINGDTAVNTGDVQTSYINRADYLNKMKEAQEKNDHVAIKNLRAQRKSSLKFDNK